MNISLLSGAYKNAGDFLIVSRCKELLQNSAPNTLITEYERGSALDEVIEQINKTDVLVIGGGPAYIEYLYPKIIPLVENLEDIKVPIFAMALGWNGQNDFSKAVYKYSFSDSTKKLLRRIENDGYSLGCRDFFSERVLQNNGMCNTIMTGCSAWYDLQYINCFDIQNNGEIKSILLSDPASSGNYKQFLNVIKYVKKRFTHAEIKVVFHRGVNYDKYTDKETGKSLENLCREIKHLNIEYIDISYDSHKMNVYSKCDLHIGYRVHAHIYNLSQRRRSILIEEDGRGAGVDEALGLRQIRAYNELKLVESEYVMKILRRLSPYNTTSEFVCMEIEDYLQELEKNEYVQFEWAFKRMNYYYSKMCKHLSQLIKK